VFEITPRPPVKETVDGAARDSAVKETVAMIAPAASGREAKRSTSWKLDDDISQPSTVK
jgi:hypothetical protein